ncbi:hypothetical protein OH76DRAFT_1483874 [Lentinus brumalis]|uniref:Uncharacterized protein n=1 Tax=Lentinus brumalis TaxID=2498619 RepID=A0A371D7K6_9APHY|nr:hypothetical protein OH76DRAFT_1483874 [Polyporus brumalis]
MSSDDDAAALQSIGHDLIQFFVAVVVETFAIAVYSVLVFKTGLLLLRKSRTTLSLCTCTAVFVMFGLALSLWMIDIHNVVIEIQLTLLSTTADSLDDAYGVAVSQVLRLASVEDVLYAYMTLVGDSIIIWRVYAFWSQGAERLILIVPIAFLLGSIASSMMLSYCASRLGADIVLGTYQNPAFCRNIQTASYSTTLATTGVATTLIAYKVWEYRRTYLEAFGTSSKRTRTQQIMVSLVESGIIYMLFFLVQVIVSLASVNDKIESRPSFAFAFTVYSFSTSCIVGIYPTAVVLLVNSRHSVLKTTSMGGSSDYTGSAGGIRSKHSHGTGQSAYMHTVSSATTMPTNNTGRVTPTAVDLYEMARIASKGSSDALKESDLDPEPRHGHIAVKVRNEQETVYDV